MDENKLNVLKEVDYSVHKVCGLCSRGRFDTFSDWALARNISTII